MSKKIYNFNWLKFFLIDDDSDDEIIENKKCINNKENKISNNKENKISNKENKIINKQTDEYHSIIISSESEDFIEDDFEYISDDSDDSD
jgi:hypothetical protein